MSEGMDDELEEIAVWLRKIGKNQKQINKILKENKDVFEMLENYDITRELPSQRKRIYITLATSTLNKLKKLREQTGKPVSRIIEEKLIRVS